MNPMIQGVGDSMRENTLPAEALASVYVALDFETADYRRDSACAVGMAKIQQGVVVDTWYSLIRPPRKRVLFTDIHGLSWEDVCASPTFGSLWPAMHAFFQDARFLIAHNAVFDRSVLAACCQSAGITAPLPSFLCTLKGARRHMDLPDNRLNTVCAHCGIDLQHHHAGSDAMAAAEVFLYLLRQGVSERELLLRQDS